MILQKDIKLFDDCEVISVVYTEQNFDAKDTALTIYDTYKISILMSDGMNAVIGDTLIKGEKNSILFFRPDEPHFGRVSCPGRQLYIDFLIPISFIEKFYKKETVFKFMTDRSVNRVNYITFDVKYKKTISEISMKIVEILKSDCENGDLKLFSLMLQITLLCIDFYEKQKEHPSESQMPYAVTKTMGFILENFGMKLSLKQLAESANCSVAYLSRIFKQYTGITIYNYITITRIANAQIMLNGGASVTEACFSSGFNDCSNFIRTFKKTTGMTPIEYRNKR